MTINGFISTHAARVIGTVLSPSDYAGEYILSRDKVKHITDMEGD
jgi:hypothetical protein